MKKHTHWLLAAIALYGAAIANAGERRKCRSQQGESKSDAVSWNGDNNTIFPWKLYS